ncbi:hypothetical protein ACHAWF_010886 [Thalassiosira exigua]
MTPMPRRRRRIRRRRPSSALALALAALSDLTFASSVSAASNPTAGGGNLVQGAELRNELDLLRLSISHIASLLEDADVPNDSEIASRTSKLVRRVRELVQAADLARADLNPRERARRLRVERRVEARRRERRLRGGVGSGAAEEVPAEADEEVEVAAEVEGEDTARALASPGIDEEEDEVARRLFDATIRFPECNGKYLDDCLQILNEELAALQMDCDIVVHEKRNRDQEGYNKVVIVTDLTATHVRGRFNDGVVHYPFLWDDAVEGYARTLGVDGKWDCLALSPEECCSIVLASAPHPDAKGNALQCHIFVPFGGVGNRKRDDRVLVNLSPDGRVHEAPIIS